MRNNKKLLKKSIFVIGLVFVALNLRPAITSVGPLIQDIRNDLGISNGVAGLLTTVPLLAFAILSLFAPRIGRKFGNEAAIILGLFLLGIGIVVRPFESVTLLFLGTILIGVGIAIVNVLLPGIIKGKFPAKIGLMTGVYTLSMGLAASLGSGLSIPISQQMQLGWENALRFWVFLVMLAIVAWLPQLKKDTSVAKKVRSLPTKSSLWKSKLAWQVTLFMGIQSFLFYCMISWLPEILASRGMDLATAGWLVGFMQFIGLPATFIAPVLADRLSDQKKIVKAIGFLSVIGIGLLLLDVQSILLVGLSVVMMGTAFGASISLALTFISLRTRNAEQAANLSGMAQSVGYLLAACGPFMIGFLYDWYASWSFSLIVLVGLSIVMMIAGVGAGQAKYVDDENKSLMP
ncbi:MFS transporter [Bacillus sp. JCM 19034]|uniref:CynX/NimT family MFS transporter n=1 Tax=Bacillus sp. JCM 19034 TaxID=1481928 RepID=UPI0007864FD9|nr:MFS transporter [Bacillus sp. JCM 19034]